MKLDQLRRMALFALVAQEGSLTKVANQQGIATSAISAAVSQLESELNTRLLHRSTRQITLTDVGQAFFRHCQLMLNEADHAHETISELTGQLAGQLTLSASRLDAETIALPALAPLLRAHPKLILNVQINDRQVDLVAQGIDIALRAGVLHNTNLIARPLMPYHEAIVASPDYLRQYGTPAGIADLAAHRIIAFTPFAQPDTLTLSDAEGRFQTASLAIAAQSNEVDTVRRLACLGLGVARLPLLAVKEDLSAGRLKSILPDCRLPSIHLYAVTLKRDLQPAKVTAAIEAIQQFIRQQWG